MLETRLKTAGIDHTVLDLARSKKFYMDEAGGNLAEPVEPD